MIGIDGGPIAKRIVEHSDGEVSLVRSDDRVLSLQPDGTWEDRDPGSYGQYERATVLLKSEKFLVVAYRPADVVYIRAVALSLP